MTETTSPTPEAPADEAPTTDAPSADEAPTTPPADEPPTPSAATLEPPAPKVTEKTFTQLPTTADIAAARLASSERTKSITDSDGNPVDPDQVFIRVGPKTMKCNVRLIEHTTAARYDRPTRTLLMAKGRECSESAANIILDKIRGLYAERAEHSG